MFSISSNGIIQLSKGDTCYGDLFINIGTELSPRAYNLRDVDALYFGVMQAGGSFKDALICKKLTSKDKTPGVPPVVGGSLGENVPGKSGTTYYTRVRSDEGPGWLNDGTYKYSPVRSVPDQHPADVYFYLWTVGQSYDGYYRIEFETEDTEHVVPGVYYYEAKLSRLDPTPTDPEHRRVDTIVSRTKFIIHE